MKFATFTFLIFFSLSVFPQSWIQKTTMPGGKGLDAPFSFVLNDTLYVGGGWNDSISLSTFYAYNAGSNTWTQRANTPGPIYSTASFSLNGKGYVVCGTIPSLVNTVYQYDPAANSWQTLNNFPGGARQNTLGFSVGSKGYLFGGFTGTNTVNNDLWQYDDSTDTWTQMTSCPGPGRNTPSCLIITGKIYIGLGGDVNGSAAYSDFYCFNPDSNTYTPVTNIPVGRGGAVNFTLGSTGYIGMGANTLGSLTDFYTYDAVSDVWTQIDSFPGAGRFGAYCQVIGGVPYVGCGVATSGSYLIDNWSYGYPTGLQNINTNNSTIKCYPSPTSGGFTIDMSAYHAGDKQISIYDQLGQVVYQTTSSQSKVMVNNKFALGIYTVSVTQGASHGYAKVAVE